MRLDRNQIQNAIVNTISLFKSESDRNQRSNLDSEFELTMMIQFGRPNRISFTQFTLNLPQVQSSLLKTNLELLKGDPKGAFTFA